MRSHGKNRRDQNEPAVFDMLRAHGLQVQPLHTPCDALVGFRGVTHLVEVKNGPKAQLTSAQEVFIARWTGSPVVVLDSVEAAEKWAKEVRG